MVIEFLNFSFNVIKFNVLFIMNTKKFKVDWVSNALFGMSIVLFIGAFLLPNEFNTARGLWLNDIRYNFEGYYFIYSLAFIPVAFAFLGFRKYATGFWLSFIVIPFQIFSVAIHDLISMSFLGYFVSIFMIFFVLFAFYQVLKTGFKKNMLLVGVVALYYLLVFAMSLPFNEPDNGNFLIAYSLASFMVLSLKERISFKLFVICISILYIISFSIMFINLNCNYKFNYDVAVVDWSMITIYERCSTFVFLTLGAIVFNFAIILKWHAETGIGPRTFSLHE